MTSFVSAKVNSAYHALLELKESYTTESCDFLNPLIRSQINLFSAYNIDARAIQPSQTNLII